MTVLEQVLILSLVAVSPLVVLGAMSLVRWLRYVADVGAWALQQERSRRGD